jgi:hypothetical protein
MHEGLWCFFGIRVTVVYVRYNYDIHMYSMLYICIYTCSEKGETLRINDKFCGLASYLDQD